MRKFLTKVMLIAMLAMPVVACAGVVQNVWADCGGVSTNLIDCDTPDGDTSGQAIFSILKMVVRIFSSIVMIAAVVGMIVAGIQYLTARDNEGQVVKAKMRILQIVIGIVVYALVWAFLEWIIPGGVGTN